jgi:hypothetical protein
LLCRLRVRGHRQDSRSAGATRMSEKWSKFGAELWDQAKLIDGTPAEAYLRGRGISLAPGPEILRFTTERARRISSAANSDALSVPARAGPRASANPSTASPLSSERGLRRPSPRSRRVACRGGRASGPRGSATSSGRVTSAR